MKALLADIGCAGVQVVIHTDSATGKSIASRRGVGRMRHLEVHNLWVQEKVKDGILKVCKAAGNKNPADVLTRPKSLR